MKRAVYAGSFDPPTNGHMFMIREGARLFDELVVAIGINPDKRSTFTLEQRLGLLHAVTCHLTNVRVDAFENQFLVRYASSIGADYILRGIRNAADFEYERTMRHVNQDMVPGVTSVFLMPPRELAETSSSFVKGLVGPHGWRDVVQSMVPAPVFEAILALHPTEEVRD
ncbi:MAG: pantetheine-phosphate adenylyltransferase [Dehalococcoidia bacterium]